jgi:hypothetical protein
LGCREGSTVETIDAIAIHAADIVNELDKLKKQLSANA